MQRAGFAPGPAHSPPLHHPVPQHVSTVPMMRSPPPPAGQQQQQTANSYGNPYQPQGPPQGMGNYAPQFGNFINDPTAQMGMQMGQTAFNAGQKYMEQNLKSYISVSALKHYFNVSNSYVLRKLLLVLFPWRHKPWSRQQGQVVRSSSADGQQQYSTIFLPPRDDLNSPDMYIPTMSVITYILLSTVLAGIRGTFRPELLSSILSSALAVVFIEIVLLKVMMYILNISNESQLLDLVAYSGYKFVGATVTLAVTEVLTGSRGTSGWIGWVVFFYTFMANALFLLRSLKYVLLPEAGNDAMHGSASYTIARGQRTRRMQFLFTYAYLIQFFFMWVLTREEPAATTVVHKVQGDTRL